MSTISGSREWRRPERVVQLLDRERRVRVHAAIALVMRAVGRRDERGRIVELGHQAVHDDRVATSSPPFIDLRFRQDRRASRRSRSSAGSAGTGTAATTNRPIVPTKVDQSQNVGAYMPHDEGRKSRCRLVTTMTKRSSHMPTFTTSAMMNSTGTFDADAPEPQRLRDHDVAEDQRPVHERVRAGHPVPRSRSPRTCRRCTRR